MVSNKFRNQSKNIMTMTRTVFFLSSVCSISHLFRFRSCRFAALEKQSSTQWLLSVFLIEQNSHSQHTSSYGFRRHTEKPFLTKVISFSSHFSLVPPRELPSFSSVLTSLPLTPGFILVKVIALSQSFIPVTLYLPLQATCELNWNSAWAEKNVFFTWALKNVQLHFQRH